MTRNGNKEKKSTLQLKILSGYVLLASLVGGIITAVWYEKRVFEHAEAEEREMLEQRKLSNRTFKGLISLFLDNERATLWDETDLQAYRDKQERVYGFIEELRQAYPDPVQQARIDTVELLLDEKEKQVRQLVQSPSPIRQIDELLEERMPALVASVTGQDVRKTQTEERQAPPKRGVLSWLKRKSKRAEEPPARSKDATHPSRYLLGFQEEMGHAIQEQEAHLAQLSDSLKTRNRTLNRNINRLVNEFEEDAMRRTEQRQDAVSQLREQAFSMICVISTASLLCVILLYMLIYKDVRRKYRYQKELEEADKRSRELLLQRKKIMLTLAHDIRGPLNTISGSAELASGIREKRKRDSHLQNIRHSCGHILRLVNDLLDVYRLNEGKDTPNLVPFRLDSLLGRITEEYCRSAHSKGLLFDTVTEGTDITVTGDADRIEQIADNLLSNAIKFTPAGGVRFTARHTDGMLGMEVSDTGIGMAQADIGRIFHPFERAAQHIDTEGFGLGLPITQSLVKLLDGSIRVESEPGRGSRFTVRLPLRTTDEAVTEAAVALPSFLPAHLRIAAIDDDPMQLRIVKEMLERNGVHCDTCTHIRELMESIRKTDYDLLLTDIQMRDTGGFDLLKLLRSARIGNSRDIPVVAMTARGDTRQEVFARAGFAGCIYKPFSMMELLQTVSRHAAQRGNDAAEPAGGADFTVLTTDMRDPSAVLDTFIHECRKDRHELEGLIRRKDKAAMESMVHRLLPLWEMLGVESPLTELGAVLRADKAEEKTDEAAGRVLLCMENLAAQAARLKGGMEK
ncbi:response regulator [Bacteroides fragilis str. S24L15]|uniref:hybrid sensor histidine kinase/response regulator n=1 Tax=Bacteroides fragilis TaxID=817 RepID=UPI00044ACF26|nr:hybrid sensor histidine kinase/response regulator [Bacteroides fragilis]EYA71749.1 response regulator [Bacteroides fragilis str. S24L15]EYA74007.1 response regulator [Bacteroides fragilis str. S24L26]